MAQRTIQNSEALAKQIRSRRNELGLTIEEAASRADVGTKTWCRYEAGEAIRQDKCKGICKALNWSSFPGEDADKASSVFSIDEYKAHRAWSADLEENFGAHAALAFAVGSDILLDHIKEDLEELASMPSGSHIGQLSVSWLRDDLPEQFLTQYTYDFLYRMKCALLQMRAHAKRGDSMIAHSVLEELLIYRSNEEAKVMFELEEENVLEDYEEDWPFDLFDDMDIVSYLYSNRYLEPDHNYHFAHWAEPQFYLSPTQ